MANKHEKILCILQIDATIKEHLYPSDWKISLSKKYGEDIREIDVC